MFRVTRLNFQRQVILHRIFYQPSSNEHASRLGILHIGWFARCGHDRFQSYAYVLVQSRDRSLGHLAGGYHIRRARHELGRCDHDVTLRRTL